MHDDYDFTATFDFDDCEWKAIDDALALLEEKFAMLDEPVEEAEEGCFPFDPSAEAYTRRAIGELLRLDDEMREMIIARAPMRSLKEAARARGTVLLRDVAVDAALQGLTTLEEVGRVTYSG